jgi:hypothetical protein
MQDCRPGRTTAHSPIFRCYRWSLTSSVLVARPNAHEVPPRLATLWQLNRQATSFLALTTQCRGGCPLWVKSVGRCLASKPSAVPSTADLREADAADCCSYVRCSSHRVPFRRAPAYRLRAKSARYKCTLNFEGCGHAESKKTLKFMLRTALRPNQIEFSHSLGQKQPLPLSASVHAVRTFPLRITAHLQRP